MARNDLQGSLDLLVLKTLSQVGSLHGYGIVLHIQRASDELLNVEEGSLYPALHRMEQGCWIAAKSDCGRVKTTEIGSSWVSTTRPLASVGWMMLPRSIWRTG